MKPGWTVFDVGTGTGILAMIASHFGAKKVRAFDYDDVAVKVAHEKITHNHLQNVIEVKQNDLLAGVDGKADLIAANIIADIIIRLLPQVKTRLKAGGFFLASGIIEERRDDVIQAAHREGFELAEEEIKEDWVAQVWRLPETI
jgi:ribosomal protein L11 methyltransferase